MFNPNHSNAFISDIYSMLFNFNFCIEANVNNDVISL